MFTTRCQVHHYIMLPASIRGATIQGIIPMIETADDAINYMKRFDGKALVISEAIAAQIPAERVRELEAENARLRGVMGALDKTGTNV